MAVFYEKYIHAKEPNIVKLEGKTNFSCENIAIVTYKGTLVGENSDDAARIAKMLTEYGANVEPIHQWEFRDQSPAFFEKFDLVILPSGVGRKWDAKALLVSDTPVLMLNSAYADDFGIAHISNGNKRLSVFEVVDNAHEITKKI
ncbi:hypothetical protein WL047_21735 [Vibrio alginolyticus]|uniref:hypothetical protein n=1 Tax=Vibrio alginolyticus TaxID=663 RepID=UPI003754009E